MKKILLAVFAAVFFAAQAHAANFCSDIVVDEAGLLNSSQTSQVADAAQKLKSQGVDVRVQLLPNLHGQQSLVALKDNFIGKCGSWRAKDGGMKNDLVVLMIAMNPGKLGIFYGDGLKQKLDSRTTAIQDSIAAKLRDGHIAAGVVAGLGDVTDLVQMKASQQGVPVRIEHAADMSGLWTVMGWLLGIVVAVLIVFGAVRLFGEKERRRNAQNKAQTERSRCSAAVNSFESSYAIVTAKVKQSPASETKKAKLLAEAADIKARHGRALSDFSAIGRNGNDPDAPNLSVAEYESMERGYANVAKTLSELSESLDRILSRLNAPEVEETAQPAETPKPRKWGPEGSLQFGKSSAPKPHKDPEPPKRRPRAEPEPAPVPPHSQAPVGHTTVINNTTVQQDDGFLTGVVVGSILSDHGHHHHYDDAPAPRYEPPPAPSSRGSGEETGFSRSSMGNGTETGFGFSGKGGGSETSLFGGADFGRAPDPEPEPERSRDCAPSDCRETDCKPSDCAKSDCDCNCDCNCDCTSTTD